MRESHELPEERDRGSVAVKVADISDMIESESRVVRRMRWFELPIGVVAVLFFMTMLATDTGATGPLTILLIMFSVLLTRNVLRYSRRASHLLELEEQLAELESDGGRSRDAEKKAPRGLLGR